MKYIYSSKIKGEHVAKAVGMDVPISTKQAIEICNFIRDKSLQKAKSILREVIEKKRAVPFRRFNKDVGHKTGIGPGRYPEKSSKEILRIVESAEANAQFKGLATNSLVIRHLCVHKASQPWHFGRKRRRQMKRSHIEIILEETAKKETASREKSVTPKEKKLPAEHEAKHRNAADVKGVKK